MHLTLLASTALYAPADGRAGAAGSPTIAMDPDLARDARRLVDRPTASKFLGLSDRTLQRLSTEGGGPPYIRPSPGRVAYRISDLIAWADARRFASTSAETAGILAEAC